MLFFARTFSIAVRSVIVNTAHSDSLSTCLSAADTSLDILVSRRYGGTAVLYRKCLVDKINIANSHESRITGIRVQTNAAPLLLINL